MCVLDIVDQPEALLFKMGNSREAGWSNPLPALPSSITKLLSFESTDIYESAFFLLWI